MKHLFYSLIILFLLGIWAPAKAQNAFNKGVNLTGWFSGGSARSIPFYKYTKKDIENIKSLGCDVIRLPINLHYMTSGQPDYKVDTMLYHYLDQVITWTDELGLKLILDNHTIDGANAKTVEVPLMKIWPQIARHYKNAPTSVIYEILNEPNTFAVADWAKIQKNVLDTIRTIDTLHTVIVTGADWGGIAGLTKLLPLADKKLIYSFHFYDPFLFTHQAATWASPSLGDLGNVPFPYNASKMPACPVSLKGTWVESGLNTSYKTDGTVAKLKSTIDQAINFGKKYNVKIFCGELGVYNAKSPVADRANWYKAVTGYLTEKSVPWTMWDYQGGFGLFNKGSNETFEYDINRTMAEGMGFALPPYKEFVMKPDTASFDIYTDFMGEGIQYGGVPGGGIADLFAPNPYQGTNCIYLTGTPQYGALDFDFTFNKDLSMLKNANSYVSLWVKGSAKDASVTLRFLDTKTADPNDHPWRMDYTLVSTTKAPFDGKWYNVTIPLKSFLDVGSWDGVWINSQNKFDWTAVDKFQIVSERAALTGKEFWIDNISLERGSSPLTGNYEIGIQSEVSIYPNPASEKVNIRFFAPVPGTLEVTVHDLSGRLQQTLFSNNCTPGVQKIVWHINNQSKPVENGMYICKVKFNNKEITRKISIIN
jgi:endoglucanase